MTQELVSVRYPGNDAQESTDFYLQHFEFGLRTSAAKSFADVARDRQRLRDARVSFPDGIVSEPGGPGILVGEPSGSLIEPFQPTSR